MEYGFLLLVLAGVGAFFMAFNNGANDVANSFASAVGAKAISMQQAVLIAGLMNLLGAVLIGGNVSAKLVVGVVNPVEFGSPGAYVLAMFSVLLAAGTFVLLSTFASLPVSSSHSIVGSLIGVSLVAGGLESVNSDVLLAIIASWFISPILAGAMSLGLYSFIERRILAGGKPMERLRFFLPFILAITVAVFVLILMKGSTLKQYRPSSAWEMFLFMAVLLPYATLVVQGLLRSAALELEDTREAAEGVFRKLQVGTSSYVAFAHGANDVANAISPVYAIFLVVSLNGALPTEALVAEIGVPLWVLILGGAGIATGIAALGHRVIRTLSEKITRIDNFKGFSVDFSAATTVVSASLLGLPVSSTHAATGAIVGTGLREGKGVDWRLLGKILVTWILTVPAAGLITVGLFLALKAVFL